MDIFGIIKSAISAVSMHNGWAMAVLGISIVFSGLVVLSIVIAQLHKFLLFIEKREDEPQEASSEKASASDSLEVPEIFPEDVNEAAAFYKPLFEELGSSFKLTELYTLTEKNNFPHPHLTITRFRNAGILVPEGEGFFSWHLAA